MQSLASTSRTFLAPVARTIRPVLPRRLSINKSRKAVHFFSTSAPTTNTDPASSTPEANYSSTAKSASQRGFPLGGAAAGLALLASSAGYYFLNSEEPLILAPDRWTPVKIESVERLTQDTNLFRIKVPRSVLPQVLSQDPDAKPILSLYVKEPTLQIQRAYTPLNASCFNPDGTATLELVVKRYPDGEVSRYMHRLRPGDEISIRAPSVTWYYRPKDWDEVVFIAGGTGVTPAYQCINDSQQARPSASSPTLSLVYASASPSSIFLRPQLDQFNKTGTLSKVRYHVDRSDQPTLPENTRLGLMDGKSLEEFVGRKDPTTRRVIVICGPEGLINAVAGPRGRNFSQGPVGGILKDLGYSDREVVKL